MEFLPSIELISNNLVVIVDECLDFSPIFSIEDFFLF